MKLRGFIRFISVMILIVLSACQGQNDLGPVKAAARQVVDSRAPEMVNDPQSIEIKQAQAFEDSTYVVLTYQRMWKNRDENCLAMYETHYEFLRGWVAGSGSGSCTTREDEAQAGVESLHFSGGTIHRSDQKKPPVSFMLGRVNDPSIVKVNITWQDGQKQEAQVVDGSVLAIRSGDVQIKLAVGLDEQDTAVHTIIR